MKEPRQSDVLALSMKLIRCCEGEERGVIKAAFQFLEQLFRDKPWMFRPAKEEGE